MNYWLRLRLCKADHNKYPANTGLEEVLTLEQLMIPSLRPICFKIMNEKLSTCETDNILMKVIVKNTIGDSSYQPMKEMWSLAGSPGQDYRRLARWDANDTEIQTLQHLRMADVVFVMLLSHCVHNRCTWIWCFVVYRKHAVIYFILIIGKHHLSWHIG